MKERPILFSAPMVIAILEGRKTQTRRLYKPKKGYPYEDGEITPTQSSTWTEWGPCRYGQPGDRLWVKETWARFNGDGPPYLYRADSDGDGSVPYLVSGAGGFGGGVGNAKVSKWRPSIFMPRWASRITLEITHVRVERLQEITEDDAQAEGCDPFRVAYKILWNSINGPGSWDMNPWVWVIEFKRV